MRANISLRLALVGVASAVLATVGGTQQAVTGMRVVRASCTIDTPQARQCAVTRLGSALQAAIGSPEPLEYDQSALRFRGTQSQREVPATVRYTVDSSEVRAEVTLDLNTAPAAQATRPDSTKPVKSAKATVPAKKASGLPSRRWWWPFGRTVAPAASPTAATQQGAAQPHTVTASPSAKLAAGPAAAAKPKAPPPRLIVVAPASPIRTVIGLPTAHPVRFAMRRVVGVDSQIVIPQKAACRTSRRSRVVVRQVRIEPTGDATCWVQLAVGADTVAPATVQLVLTAGKEVARGVVVLTPVPVPLLAVRAVEPACQELAKRVEQEMVARGRPQVTWNQASRRIELTRCEQFNRLLPVRRGDTAPSGLFVRGEAWERGFSVEVDPTIVGEFQFSITRPGADATTEAVREIVDRLLKYRSL